jgi:dethiobiotin synthetase
MDRRRIVLVGTGTGIGKTHLGVALVKALAAAGVEVVGLKPVESGIGTGVTDAELLAGAAGFQVRLPRPYALAAPLSPHLAAPLEGITIRLSAIVQWVDSVEAAWVLVETAGALLSPLAPGLTNHDLTVALGGPGPTRRTARRDRRALRPAHARARAAGADRHPSGSSAA